ncbi:MAG TPA: UDP-N-acetylmuramoyl-L-alanyl-D-glutamate--2,6-diaminopimelate ligase [Desulfobacteraceae bacterium]|nr:UDP-N-acetylmuramoyl-L-alanyl-D-glutamate--2,6-diaminopimelate ligase [Desulfobacteraceae bacterium]
MQLGRLVSGMTVMEFLGDPETEIEGLAYDSREVKPGYLFVALRGQTLDGHDFIKKAVQNGAVAIVAESSPGENICKTSALVKVPSSRVTLSELAASFYNRPFKNMNLVGITGTNGKTTTSYLLESILLAAGARPGVIGTINYRMPGQTWEAPVTTPESLDLMKTLRKMADANVTDVVIEVSSHSLVQGRIKGCPFRIAVFTNLTRDHLDYHGSMEEYFRAKSLLFSGLKKGESNNNVSAVINMDDTRGKDLTGLTDAAVMTYGLGKDCHVRADLLQSTKDGLVARLITPAGETDIQSSLIGDFNIYNIMAASAVALCMDIDLDTVALGINNLKCVPGRLEVVKNSRSLVIVVDYAHTPDALLKALEAARNLAKGHLITVFGCGGDRDRGKRREMGRVAGNISDVVFITSDNPRTEDPSAIASPIEKGVRQSGLGNLEGLNDSRMAGCGYVLDLDRRNAIRRAVGMAGETDIVLIAGKGHEDYQVIGKGRRYFDDRKEALEAASGDI